MKPVAENIKLAAQNIHVGFSGADTVLHGVDLELNCAEITAVIGPNGSGKSTLLSALAGLLVVRSGEVSLNGINIQTYHRRELAKQIAYLPQQPQAPEELTVRRIVAHGRFAHRKRFMPLGSLDYEAIAKAMEDTRTTQFADRPFHNLSGGEKQRVWLALALAQRPKLLLLDEPTSYLDMGFQFELLDLLKGLCERDGIGIAMVLHDVNQAAWYADRVIALNAGRIIGEGTPEEVITPKSIKSLFDIDVRMVPSGMEKRTICVPAHL